MKININIRRKLHQEKRNAQELEESRAYSNVAQTVVNSNLSMKQIMSFPGNIPKSHSLTSHDLNIVNNNILKELEPPEYKLPKLATPSLQYNKINDVNQRA